MVSIARNFGPVPQFEGIRIGQHDPMSINAVVIDSHVAINASGEVAVSEIHSHVNSSAGGILYGAKSRGTTNSPTIVNSGDELFGFWGIGFDGVDYAVAAHIKFAVDGTPGSNDMPGRIIFSTSADGSQSPTERLRIASDGLITVSNGVITCPHTGTNSERFGYLSVASGDNASSFGNLATSAINGAAFGYNAFAEEESVCVGPGTYAANSSGPNNGSVAVGFGAASSTAGGSVVGGYSINSGAGSTIVGSYSTIGNSSNATIVGPSNTIGDSCTSTTIVGTLLTVADGATFGVLIGYNSSITGGADNVVAIGGSSAHSNTISIGRGAAPTATNQALIGGTTCNITTLYVGKGVTNATPDAIVTITTTGETGTNQSGSTLNIQGGISLGTGAGAGLTISSGETASGTTPQTQRIRATWFPSGAGGFVGNDGAFDYDHRWESVNDPNLVTLDASTDSIGHGVALGSHVGKVHIQQISTTGAKPVLTLQQKDLSEEFLRLIGESADDNSQSLVDAANLATPGTVAGWFKVYVQDDKASGAITDGIYYVPFYTTPT